MFKDVSLKIKCKLFIMGYGVNKNLIKNFIKTNQLKNNIKVIGFS